MQVRRFSCVWPVYQPDPMDLDALLHTYAGYPRDIVQRVQFVIVDDGSPVPVQIPDDFGLDVLHARILEDIPWNVSGAKNLGVVLSRWPHVLVTDVDHLIPLETVASLLLGPPPEDAYLFSRLESGGMITPHPGTFFMSRSRYLDNHGMDEDFSGHYGYEDIHFLRYQRARGTRFLRLDHCVEVIGGAPADARARDSSFNEVLLANKVHPDGKGCTHSTRMLRFPWTVDPSRGSRRPGQRVSATTEWES